MNKKDFFQHLDAPYILDKHHFYVTEARKRIFEQFSDSKLDVEARKIEQYSFEDASKRFDPDYDDEGSIMERAHEEGISHWLALDEMKNNVSLAMTAGMFHLFDKELRKKCILECRHRFKAEVIASMIWDISFEKLIEMLEWIGMDIIQKNYYDKIDICRLVVNIYKHGDGQSHQALSTAHPEFYRNNNIFDNQRFSPHHEQLEVTEAQFIEFADAITAFWNDKSIYCMNSSIKEPKWFNQKYLECEKKVQKLRLKS